MFQRYQMASKPLWELSANGSFAKVRAPKHNMTLHFCIYVFLYLCIFVFLYFYIFVILFFSILPRHHWSNVWSASSLYIHPQKRKIERKRKQFAIACGQPGAIVAPRQTASTDFIVRKRCRVFVFLFKIFLLLHFFRKLFRVLLLSLNFYFYISLLGRLGQQTS